MIRKNRKGSQQTQQGSSNVVEYTTKIKQVIRIINKTKPNKTTKRMK